jgi:hypothetical protein
MLVKHDAGERIEFADPGRARPRDLLSATHAADEIETAVKVDQLADQTSYGFWRANEGERVEELPAPEQIPIHLSKLRFVTNT